MVKVSTIAWRKSQPHHVESLRRIEDSLSHTMETVSTIPWRQFQPYHGHTLNHTMVRLSTIPWRKSHHIMEKVSTWAWRKSQPHHGESLNHTMDTVSTIPWKSSFNHTKETVSIILCGQAQPAIGYRGFNSYFSFPPSTSTHTQPPHPPHSRKKVRLLKSVHRLSRVCNYRLDLK